MRCFVKFSTTRKARSRRGSPDALFARLAQDCGYQALHLSGNAIHRNFCLPDRNLLTVTQIAQRAAQIAEATDIPLIVDGGSACVETIALARAVKHYERAGAAALRFEDALVNEYGASVDALAIAPIALMTERIKAAADARRDPSLVLIARCDSRPQESLAQVQDRLAAYAEAGADALGVQLSEVEDFRRVGAAAPAPLVSMWPRTCMAADEFIQMGFRVALHAIERPSRPPRRRQGNATRVSSKPGAIEITSRDKANSPRPKAGIKTWAQV